MLNCCGNKLAILILSFNLYGCNSDGNGQSTHLGLSAPIIITNSGIFVHWESERDALIGLHYSSTFERWWIETQQCLGMTTDNAPIVVIVDNIHDFCPKARDKDTATYCPSNGLPYIYIPTTQSIDIRVWKHEFIHHIMESNSRYEHRTHGPEHLWQCQWN